MLVVLTDLVSKNIKEIYQFLRKKIYRFYNLHHVLIRLIKVVKKVLNGKRNENIFR